MTLSLRLTISTNSGKARRQLESNDYHLVTTILECWFELYASQHRQSSDEARALLLMAMSDFVETVATLNAGERPERALIMGENARAAAPARKSGKVHNNNLWPRFCTELLKRFHHDVKLATESNVSSLTTDCARLAVCLAPALMHSFSAYYDSRNIMIASDEHDIRHPCARLHLLVSPWVRLYFGLLLDGSLKDPRLSSTITSTLHHYRITIAALIHSSQKNQPLVDSNGKPRRVKMRMPTSVRALLIGWHGLLLALDGVRSVFAEAKVAEGESPSPAALVLALSGWIEAAPDSLIKKVCEMVLTIWVPRGAEGALSWWGQQVGRHFLRAVWLTHPDTALRTWILRWLLKKLAYRDSQPDRIAIQRFVIAMLPELLQISKDQHRGFSQKSLSSVYYAIYAASDHPSTAVRDAVAMCLTRFSRHANVFQDVVERATRLADRIPSERQKFFFEADTLRRWTAQLMVEHFQTSPSPSATSNMDYLGQCLWELDRKLIVPLRNLADAAKHLIDLSPTSAPQWKDMLWQGETWRRFVRVTYVALRVMEGMAEAVQAIEGGDAVSPQCDLQYMCDVLRKVERTKRIAKQFTATHGLLKQGESTVVDHAWEWTEQAADNIAKMLPRQPHWTSLRSVLDQLGREVKKFDREKEGTRVVFGGVRGERSLVIEEKEEKTTGVALDLAMSNNRILVPRRSVDVPASMDFPTDDTLFQLPDVTAAFENLDLHHPSKLVALSQNVFSVKGARVPSAVALTRASQEAHLNDSREDHIHSIVTSLENVAQILEIGEQAATKASNPAAHLTTLTKEQFHIPAASLRHELEAAMDEAIAAVVQGKSSEPDPGPATEIAELNSKVNVVATSGNGDHLLQLVEPTNNEAVQQPVNSKTTIPPSAVVPAELPTVVDAITNPSVDIHEGNFQFPGGIGVSLPSLSNLAGGREDVIGVSLPSLSNLTEGRVGVIEVTDAKITPNAVAQPSFTAQANSSNHLESSRIVDQEPSAINDDGSDTFSHWEPSIDEVEPEKSAVPPATRKHDQSTTMMDMIGDQTAATSTFRLSTVQPHFISDKIRRAMAALLRLLPMGEDEPGALHPHLKQLLTLDPAILLENLVEEGTDHSLLGDPRFWVRQKHDAYRLLLPVSKNIEHAESRIGRKVDVAQALLLLQDHVRLQQFGHDASMLYRSMVTSFRRA